jgi:hypothetical protein
MTSQEVFSRTSHRSNPTSGSSMALALALALHWHCARFAEFIHGEINFMMLANDIKREATVKTILYI